MSNLEFNNGIGPNPFDKLSETDLIFLLEHNADKLTEAQKLDIQARINSFQSVREHEMEFVQRPTEKVYTKTQPRDFKKAGYIDIIVLMLTVWVTCLCGMAYIYSQLNIMG